MPDPAKKNQSLPRRLFRWFRVAVLVLVLVVSALVLWSNYVAIPEFIAGPLRQELRRGNVDLEFERLRLKGFRRLVADNLRITPLSSTNQSSIHAAQAELILRYRPRSGHPINVAGVRVENGQVLVPIHQPGESPRRLAITNLNAQVDFLPNDVVRIDGLSGQTLGAKAEISGVLRNFSQFRLPERQTNRADVQWQKQLAEVADIAGQLTFAAPPQLSISFAADASDLARSRASISLRADEGTSRWGSFHRLRLTSALYPMTNQAAIKASFSFDLDDLSSDTARLSSLRLAAETQWSSDMRQLQTNHVRVSITDAHTPWSSTPDVIAELDSSQQKDRITSVFTLGSDSFSLGQTHFSESAFRADLRHTLPFPTPAELIGKILANAAVSNTAPRSQSLDGQWSFRSARTKLPRAEAESIHLSGDLSSKPVQAPFDPALSFWEYLRPFQVPWQLQLSNLAAGEVKFGNLALRGQWDFPELALTEIQAGLYNGKLSGHGVLNVGTRQVSAATESTFDYHQASVLLDPPVQRWLAQFAWENPPFVQSEFAFQLPPWTNSWENLQRDILPFLTVAGQFEGRGSFRGIPLGLAQSHFSFTNFTWTLPDLRITRPEGKALVRYSGNVTNLQVAATIESQIDPAILAPAFDKALQPAFQVVRFSTPPLVRAEIQGDLDDPRTLIARGSLSATNFFAKEQALTDLRLDFLYTNQVIEIRDLTAHRGTEQVHAPFSRIDIADEVMFVTNAVSTIDPYIAMSIVGDEVYDAIDPYRFANTPTVTINGFVPLRHVKKANIHFGVSGTDFTYWRFHLAALTGDVYWKGHELSFSNVHAAFYNGRAEWSAFFLIDDDTDTAQFSFRGTATNASLHPLVRDLFGATNRLEGTFNGDLVITAANTASIKSWNGYGTATLKDGFLWSIPIFGIFSPALESIAPGLGSTPVSSGAGHFTIENSVIHTKDLQVRAPAFRLNYKGNVDLDGKLDARVEAELLRDTWIVGKLFSTALWPVSKVFEAKVTGVLNNPKTEFRYVPKFIFAPFKVLGAIGDAARKKEQKSSGDSKSPQPSAPAQ